jgi:hypothetical protein
MINTVIKHSLNTVYYGENINLWWLEYKDFSDINQPKSRYLFVTLAVLF